METPPSNESAPYYTETILWKGVEHHLRFFTATSAPEGVNITQCQVVPFTSDGAVVMCKHIDGYNSLPGGTVEAGESYDAALSREVFEESACVITASGIFGYFEDTNSETNEVQHQLRYWAIVEPRNEPVNDPDGKALGRLIVPPDIAARVLGWGEKGAMLINLAKQAVK